MSNNHLFIGLGGTGGNIIREICKHVYVRSTTVEKMEKDYGLALDYLYIDSNDKELNATWTVLGRNVSLPKSKLKNIRAMSIQQLVEHAKHMPAILPWLGKKEFIDKVVGQCSGTPGANQRRRFGRLLFAANAADILNHIKHAIYVMEQEKNQHGVNIHLLGTLGGGTGSGSVVDLAMMLRSTYNGANDEVDYPINAYVLVTDNPGAADVGYFAQNQYSALCDINRLLTARKINFELLTDPQGKKYQSGKPLNHCYIVTDKSESGGAASKEVQEKTLADWLVQTISMQAMNNNPAFNAAFRSFSGEDLLPANPGEPVIGAERSYYFSSLGIMHWTSPEEKLKAHVAGAIAKNLLQGICYNHFKTGNGYLNNPCPSNTEDYLSAHPYSNLGLDLEHLSREPETTKEMGFTRYFRKACKTIAEGPDAAKQAETAIAAIESRLEDEWNDSFAGRGVEAYYNEKSQSMAIDRDVLLYVQKFLEPLQEAFSNGRLGMHDVTSVVKGACGQIDELLETLISSEEQRSSIEEMKVTENNMKAKASKAKAAYEGAGFFSNKQKLMDNYVKAAADYYAVRTSVRAYRYAGELLEKLKIKFDQLYNQVEKLRSELVSAISTLNDRINTHHQDRDQMKQVGSNRYVFHQQDVDDFITTTKQNKLLIEKTRKDFVLSLYNLVCNSNETGLNWLYDTPTHVDLMEQCEGWGNYVREESERRTNQNLCPGIIQSLYSIIGNDFNECKKQCEEFMKGADVLLQIDHAAPQAGTVNGKIMPTMPKKSIIIEIPKARAPQLVPFHARLKEQLESAVINVPAENVHIIETEGSDFEIAVTVCVSYMAARFATCLTNLKSKYDETVSSKAKSREEMLYFCNLDDDYDQRNTIMLAKDVDLLKNFELLMKVAKNPEINAVREVKGRNVMVVTKEGLPQLEDLGPALQENTLASEIGRISAAVMEKLKKDVPDGKETILKFYKEQLLVIGDPFDEGYQELLAEMKEVEALATEIWG